MNTYRRGRWPAIVVPGVVLVVFAEVPEAGLADLRGRVAAAASPREVVATAFGGTAADLLDAPDFTLAMTVEQGVHVAVRGAHPVTVRGHNGELTSIDGVNAIVCGEQTFADVASLAIAGPEEGAGAALPIADGVVFVSEVLWGAAEAAPAPPAIPAEIPAQPDTQPLTETQPPNETQPPTATQPPAETQVPEPAFQVPSVREPAPAPHMAPPQFEAAPVGRGGVEHTIGGGVDYASLMLGRAAAEPPAAPAISATSAEPAAPAVPMIAAPAQPVGPLGDHDGHTSSIAMAQSALASLSGAGPALVDEPGDLVLSRVCAQKHANPPQATICRLCGVPLEVDAVQVRRPALGSIRFSTGMFFELDRPLVIGRGPRADKEDPRNAPRLISLPSPGKEISRSHVRVDLDGWNVMAVDLGSTNGTYLRRGGFDDRRLMAGQPQMLTDDDVLVVEDITIRFEGLP